MAVNSANVLPAWVQPTPQTFAGNACEFRKRLCEANRAVEAYVASNTYPETLNNGMKELREERREEGLTEWYSFLCNRSGEAQRLHSKCEAQRLHPKCHRDFILNVAAAELRCPLIPGQRHSPWTTITAYCVP